MKGLLADLKHAARLYLHTPGSSAVAIIVVAIAMAFVSAFLSLYVDLALRPHPGLTDSSRLVTIGQTDGERRTGLPYVVIERLSGELTSLDQAVGIMMNSVQQEEASEATVVELVTKEFMQGLKPRIALGRGFELTEHDAEAEPVVIVSWRYWKEELGGREDVLGETIEFELRPMIFSIGPDAEPAEPEDDTREFRVIGVTAREMSGVLTDNVSLWVPYERAGGLIAAGVAAEMAMTTLTLEIVGRRSTGASAESVLTDLEAAYREREDELRLQPGFRLDAIDGAVRNIAVQRESKRQLQLFLMASVLLAFVAAANVSLFLLARAPGRRRELGIRMAIGAPLKRLARQLATESGLLIVAAASIGILMSFWLTNFLRGLAFLRRAEWQNVTLFDWRVLALVGAFLLLLTLLVSLAPILGLRRLGIAASSRQIVARATPAQRIAGAVQIAIAGGLGGAAIAFGWYLASLILGDPGYEVDNRYAVQYSVNISFENFQNFQQMMESQAAELPRRRDAIAAIPGVAAVAFGRPVPGMGSTGFTRIPDPDDPTQQMPVQSGSIDSRYIDVLGLTLVDGTAPVDSDFGVAVVNQAFARAYFGRENVVGEFITTSTGANGAQVQVVGVLEDLSFEHPMASVEPVLFRPQENALSSTAIIETILTPANLHEELVRLADDGELELRIGDVRPLAELRSNMIASDRARGFLTIGTAMLVVVLAGFGFYGTQRYLVTAGRREYAIRASLGAGPKALSRLVFVRGLMLTLPGLVIGSMLAFIAVAWLRDDYVSRDIAPLPVTLSVIAGLVTLLLIASLGPARQARRTQPAPLLRED